MFVDDPVDPFYTSGTASGGKVSIAVGGVDDGDVSNMLGIWETTCDLSLATDVTINMTASLTQGSEYEANEFSELRFTANGNTDVLASFTGDGNGGATQTTGLQTFTVSVTLPSGQSTISLGCFNNQKNFNNERTDCSFDDITITPVDSGACTVDEDFEGGAAGWVNDAASTCTTAAYVIGTPTEVVIGGGVTTQVGGANSGVNGVFTGVNTAAGTDEVDGGNCILTSPSFNVSEASTLSIAHFHGQRDAGDDPGDFFKLQVSIDGGSTFTSIASTGDQTSNAEWTTSHAAIPAGSNVVVRVECSDGDNGGDLVECGIDDVSICSN